jgi:rsbT co-antagonist protein RsbR
MAFRGAELLNWPPQYGSNRTAASPVRAKPATASEPLHDERARIDRAPVAPRRRLRRRAWFRLASARLVLLGVDVLGYIARYAGSKETNVSSTAPNRLALLLQRDESAILNDWVAAQVNASTMRSDLIKEAELRQQSRQFLGTLRAAMQSGGEGARSAEWAEVQDFLSELSRTRAQQGFRPSETATFVMSLKQPLFRRLQAETKDAAELGDALWEATTLPDRLALHTTEVHQKSREETIARQQRELLELSTPVVQLWDEILALPLVGTLDSDRTQIVMETLLHRIVESGAAVAILDITGVPTVDTLVAQHLMKTVAATRLMGADCIISGIRPQIAQTIVHLGVDLSAVMTKATLADAFAAALDKVGIGSALLRTRRGPESG